jgi:hypothetical protein
MSTTNRRAFVRTRVELELTVDVGPFGGEWTLDLMTRDAQRAARDAAASLIAMAGQKGMAVKLSSINNDANVNISVTHEKP